MIYLDAEELLHVAHRAVAGEVAVRDIGLLQSAAQRPQASAFGEAAYPDLATKAAALMQSLARNHPLVDGKNRLALAGTLAFLGVNSMRLTLTNDEAYDLVMAVATGGLDDIGEIAMRLRQGRRTRLDS